MIRKRLLHLLIAIAALMLVNGEATAFAADTAPDSDQTWLDGTPEPPNSGFADASELANLIVLGEFRLQLSPGLSA